MGHARNVSLHFDHMNTHLRQQGSASIDAAKCVTPLQHSAEAMLAAASHVASALEGLGAGRLGKELFTVMKAHAAAVSATACALAALTDYYLTAQRISVPQ
jgi:hypothetical protein